ncbi:MAG: hypothetical protein AAFR96_02000 [Planctomycetota bacterium]
MQISSTPSQDPILPAPRRVESSHHSAWPTHPAAQATEPFDHALEEVNASRRGTDRVEFSDYLRRINEETRLCDLDGALPDGTETGTPHDRETDRCPCTSVPASKSPAMPAESATPRAAAVERYEVTNRSTSGRLIDLLM